MLFMGQSFLYDPIDLQNSSKRTMVLPLRFLRQAAEPFHKAGVKNSRKGKDTKQSIH